MIHLKNIVRSKLERTVLGRDDNWVLRKDRISWPCKSANCNARVITKKCRGLFVSSRHLNPIPLGLLLFRAMTTH